MNKIAAYVALGISGYMLASMSVGGYKLISSMIRDSTYETKAPRIHLTNSISTNLEAKVEGKK